MEYDAVLVKIVTAVGQHVTLIIFSTAVSECVCVCVWVCVSEVNTSAGTDEHTSERTRRIKISSHPKVSQDSHCGRPPSEGENP